MSWPNIGNMGVLERMRELEQQRLRVAAGRVQICPECTRGVRHDLCYGSPCCCLQCSRERTMADARRVLELPRGAPGREQQLAQLLATMLAHEDQRYARRRKIKLKGYRPPYPCRCGRPGCTVTDATYRNRLYARPACAQYVWRLHKRTQARADAMAAASGITPDGWAEHWQAP